MPNTAVIGVTFVDVKGFPKSHYDPQGRNLGFVKIVHGGVSRNVVEDFANAGMPVSFVSMLEDSAIGRDVERRLLNAGADLTWTVSVSDNGLGMWLVILNETGDLAGSISRMPDISVLEEYISLRGEEIVSAAENIVLEIDLNERIAEKVLDLAERFGKNVYAIVGNMSVILQHKEYLQRTSCFICNEVEASKLFDEPLAALTPNQLCDRLPSLANAYNIPAVVVTMGAQGSVFYDRAAADRGVCPPFPTEVVDTSGAGDAFFSGTVMGLTRRLPLRDAVRYGAKLASLTIASDESACPVCPDFFNEQLSLFD